MDGKVETIEEEDDTDVGLNTPSSYSGARDPGSRYDVELQSSEESNNKQGKKVSQ